MAVLRKNGGSILVMALWSLSVLTLFALTLGTIARQKITLVARIDDRDKLHFITESGVNMALVLLKEEIAASGALYSAASKIFRHNNPGQFKGISLNGGWCDVSYDQLDERISDPQKRYGVVDEERKININTANQETLRNLIRQVAGLSEEEATKLAVAIIDWREYGESEITGFYSDEYYDNLEYPYPAKNANFELIDELLLVKGMNEDIFRSLEPFLTVYGNGRVNINTANRFVFFSLGLSPGLVLKILSVREGQDQMESTADDYIFPEEFDLKSTLLSFVELSDEEKQEADAVSASAKLTGVSYYYSLFCRAQLPKYNAGHQIKCVLNSRNWAVEYWREDYNVLQ